MWTILIIEGLIATAAVVAVVILATALTALQGRVTAGLCDGARTVATATVPPTSTRVTVEFIESNRKEFVVLGCGQLPPPGAPLVALARRLGVPLPY